MLRSTWQIGNKHVKFAPWFELISIQHKRCCSSQEFIITLTSSGLLKNLTLGIADELPLILQVGLAKILSREITQVSMQSTFDWAAPEVNFANLLWIVLWYEQLLNLLYLDCLVKGEARLSYSSILYYMPEGISPPMQSMNCGGYSSCFRQKIFGICRF